MRQATLQKRCKVGSSIPAPQRDAPRWSPAPKREPAQIRGVAEGSLNHLWCSTSRTSSPRWWKNKGLLGSLPTGKEGGLPPRRESEAAAPGEVAGRGSRTSAPPDAAPSSWLRGELRRCPLDGRREGHSRPKCLRPRSRRRRCC